MGNFTTAWTEYNLGRLMLNSTIIAIVVTVGKTIISIFAAMALVYFDFPFKSLIFVIILLTLLLPVPVRIVLLFDLVRQLGMADTFYAMIFPFFASATGTFLFRQHFQSIPDSLADAARVDGAGPIRFMTRVLVPMSMNTIGALAVIQFVYMWSQYLWPLIIMQSDNKQVIQLGLKMLTGSGRAGVKPWGPAMAGSIIAMLPPLIIFLLLQEQFMKGFALFRRGKIGTEEESFEEPQFFKTGGLIGLEDRLDNPFVGSHYSCFYIWGVLSTLTLPKAARLLTRMT